jgi:hypothetical protein
MGGSSISQNQLTGRSLGRVLYPARRILATPFPSYPKRRCNSTKSCQFDHTRGGQRPIAVVKCEGIEQVKEMVSRLLYIRAVPADKE